MGEFSEFLSKTYNLPHLKGAHIQKEIEEYSGAEPAHQRVILCTLV